MNEQNVKKGFWAALAIAVLVAACAAWSCARTYSQSVEPSSFRSFSVSAEGKVTAIPDIASFTFSVVTEGGKDIGTLQTKNTELANEAIAFVEENGVETKDIKTSQYTLEPRYQYYGCKEGPCPPPEIVGYTIRQVVAVKVRDFTKLGDILSGTISHGANAVSDFRFTVDDPTAVQEQARAEAIAKAKAKAEAIADAAGFHVGRLLSIDEGNYNPMPYYLEADRGGGVASATPSIEPGSQEVTVNVSLRYEIR